MAGRKKIAEIHERNAELLAKIERQKAAEALKQEGLSQRQIAAVVGVSQSAISLDLKGDENSSKRSNKAKEKALSGDENSSKPESPADEINRLHAEIGAALGTNPFEQPDEEPAKPAPAPPPPISRHKRLGLTEEELCKSLGGPVYRDRLERQKAAEEMSKEGLSQRQIAAVTGESHATIGRDLNGTNVPKPNGNSQSVAQDGWHKCAKAR